MKMENSQYRDDHTLQDHLMTSLNRRAIVADQTANPSFSRAGLLLTRIWELLGLLDSAARLEFPPQTSLPELQRNLIALIGNFGGVTSTELAILTGREKAQISHAVSELLKQHLIDRPGYVAPLTLSPSGRKAFEDLVLIAERGDVALCEGIPRTTISDFLNLIQRLVDRSATLLMREQELMTAGRTDRAARSPHMSTFPERLRAIGPHRPMSLMVAPRLKSLFAYLERGAAQTYRRLLDMALFDVVVISYLGDQDQLMLADLINRTRRDKGQVGRTVKQLEAAGLVTRAPNSTTRRVALCLTPAGWDVATRAYEIAKVRDGELFHEMSGSDRAIFIETLARLTSNATLILNRLIAPTTP
jgi:DNA-binding MarR family transcriptional regulator